MRTRTRGETWGIQTVIKHGMSILDKSWIAGNKRERQGAFCIETTNVHHHLSLPQKSPTSSISCFVDEIPSICGRIATSSRLGSWSKLALSTAAYCRLQSVKALQRDGEYFFPPRFFFWKVVYVILREGAHYTFWESIGFAIFFSNTESLEIKCSRETQREIMTTRRREEENDISDFWGKKYLSLITRKTWIPGSFTSWELRFYLHLHPETAYSTRRTTRFIFF